jgi:hypothetical protein
MKISVGLAHDRERNNVTTVAALIIERMKDFGLSITHKLQQRFVFVADLRYGLEGCLQRASGSKITYHLESWSSMRCGGQGQQWDLDAEVLTASTVVF